MSVQCYSLCAGAYVPITGCPRSHNCKGVKCGCVLSLGGNLLLEKYDCSRATLLWLAVTCEPTLKTWTSGTAWSWNHIPFLHCQLVFLSAMPNTEQPFSLPKLVGKNKVMCSLPYCRCSLRWHNSVSRPWSACTQHFVAFAIKLRQVQYPSRIRSTTWIVHFPSQRILRPF